MINFQILGHFLMGYRNKTDCIASCNLRGDELPKSFDEIHFIRHVITSIQSEHCALEVASPLVLKNFMNSNECIEKVGGLSTATFILLQFGNSTATFYGGSRDAHTNFRTTRATTKSYAKPSTNFRHHKNFLPPW